MMRMSHDAVLFQGPLPSTAEAGRACLYKEKPTTRSAVRQKVNSQRDRAVAEWALPGQNRLYQDARMHHSFCRAFKTPASRLWASVPALGACGARLCVWELWALPSAADLAVLLLPNLKQLPSGFAERRLVITCCVWVVTAETHILSHLTTTATQWPLIIGLSFDHSLYFVGQSNQWPQTVTIKCHYIYLEEASYPDL